MDEYQHMSGHEQSLRRVAKIQSLLEQEAVVREAILRELGTLKAELSDHASVSSTSASDSCPLMSSREDQAVAFVNGDPVIDRAAEVLRQQRFDVILSAPMLKVWARQGPDAEGKWASSDIAGLRSSRLQLLLYMLTHRGTAVGTHNVDEICRSDDVSPNALAQTMRTFRTLLHQRDPAGPYLINTKSLVQIGRHHSYIGNGYTMNADYSYLLICKKL